MDAGIYRKPSNTRKTNRQSIYNIHYYCLIGLLHGLGFASELEHIGVYANARIPAFMFINPSERDHSGALVQSKRVAGLIGKNLQQHVKIFMQSRWFVLKPKFTVSTFLGFTASKPVQSRIVT